MASFNGASPITSWLTLDETIVEIKDLKDGNDSTGDTDDRVGGFSFTIGVLWEV